MTGRNTSSPDSVRQLLDEAGVPEDPAVVSAIQDIGALGAGPAPELSAELAHMIADGGRSPRMRRNKRRITFIGGALAVSMGAGISGVAAGTLHLPQGLGEAVDSVARFSVGEDAGREDRGSRPLAETGKGRPTGGLPIPAAPGAGSAPSVPAPVVTSADTADTADTADAADTADTADTPDTADTADTANTQPVLPVGTDSAPVPSSGAPQDHPVPTGVEGSAREDQAAAHPAPRVDPSGPAADPASPVPGSGPAGAAPVSGPADDSRPVRNVHGAPDPGAATPADTTREELAKNSRGDGGAQEPVRQVRQAKQVEKDSVGAGPAVPTKKLVEPGPARVQDPAGLLLESGAPADPLFLTAPARPDAEWVAHFPTHTFIGSDRTGIEDAALSVQPEESMAPTGEGVPAEGAVPAAG